MNLEAKHGDRVVFLDKHGYDGETDQAKAKGLVKGGVYTVDGMEVHSFSSDVYLVEFPGKRFNSVMFRDENKADDEPEIKQKPKPDPRLPQFYYIRSYKHDQRNVKGNELALWWCPDSQGYTYDLAKAGQYTEAKAIEICGPHNSTLVGRGASSKEVPNNIMYPIQLVNRMAILTVNKYSVENERALSMAICDGCNGHGYYQSGSDVKVWCEACGGTGRRPS